MTTHTDADLYGAALARVRAGADARAEAAGLVRLMTLDEQLSCLDGDTGFWDGFVDMVAGGYYRHPFPAAQVPRLGFPGLHFSDGPRGIVVGRSTCFPVTMARGAGFDPELEERIGNAIGVEARIQGATFFGGVCVNLLRHPGWGRAQETYGEDPHHLGEMGAALTRGVQRHVMACVKHFACNSIDEARFEIDVTIEREVLDGVYLAHFRRVVREGVAGVMTAYNAVNGQWCGQSRELITEILREQWGFDGIVMSDFLFGLRDPVESVKAGLDVEMPFRQQRAATLHTAVEEGRLDAADVVACAQRVVATVLRFDAATDDEIPDAALLAGLAHRALAREAAAESIVLLRNEAIDGTPALPLAAGSLRRVALLGRLAELPNLGDGGSSDVHPPSAVTIADGLRDALPQVEWIDDPAAADVAIVVVGCTRDDEGESTRILPELLALMPPLTDDGAQDRMRDTEGEKLGMAPGGDRRSLRLRGEDETLIARVAALQPRCIVVMMGGSGFVVEPWLELAAAVLHVWYPGMEGGRAVADVLTGACEPGGRLPFAVPTDESHLPHFDPDAKSIRYDAWHGQWLLDRDGHQARFPYGFGLSYSRFRLASAACDGAGLVVEVENCGTRDGSTVVFLFREDAPVRRLVAFRKVRLGAGERATLRLPAVAGRIFVSQYAGDPQSLRVDVPA